MEVRPKQRYTEETNCLLAAWVRVKKKLEGASGTKPVFEQIRHEIATAGYDQPVDQIINKLSQLKKDYRDQKKDFGQSSNSS